jgi:hypothetical protein
MTTPPPLFETPPSQPPGTYPAVVTSVERVTIETAEGAKDLVRWTVVATATDGSDAEVDSLSSFNYGPRSKPRRWITALLGTAPETVHIADLVGKPCLAVLALDDDGFVTLADIIAPLVAPKAKGAASAA